MKKLILLIIFALLPIAYVNAATNADSGDTLRLTSPGANTKVSGITNLSWQIIDDNQDNVSFSINLYDGATCLNNKYATIHSGNNGETTSSYSWDTKIMQATLNLDDGLYCVRLCAQLLDNNEDNYSVCDARKFTVVNFNSLPRIISSPANTTIYEGDTYVYNVIVQDQDNDSIVYRLIQAPAFVKLDSTGKLVAGPAPMLSSDVVSASYQIIVQVDDGLSGAVNQSFILTVLNRDPQPNNNGETPQTTGNPTKIEIKSPLQNQVFSGKENKIEWEVTDEDGIKSIEISYSRDQVSWIFITNSTDGTGEYKWDVSTLPADKYYLKFDVLDNKGFTESKQSDQFIINNKADDLDSFPQITDVFPANGSVVDKLEAITGNFLPSDNAKILPDSFSIKFDGKDISEECTVDEVSFDCKVENTELGEHQVDISIEDSSEQKAELTWKFTLTAPGQTNNPDNNKSSEDTINLFGRDFTQASLILGSLICCLGLLLLFIPWIIYGIWKKRQEQSTTTTIENQYSYPYDTSAYTYPAATTVTTNYYNPEPISPAPVEPVVVIEPTPTTTTTQSTTTTTNYVEPQAVDDSQPLS